MDVYWLMMMTHRSISTPVNLRDLPRVSHHVLHREGVHASVANAAFRHAHCQLEIKSIKHKLRLPARGHPSKTVAVVDSASQLLSGSYVGELGSSTYSLISDFITQ